MTQEVYEDDDSLHDGDACPECGCYGLEEKGPIMPDHIAGASNQEQEAWEEAHAEDEPEFECHHCGWRSDE